MLPFSIGNDVCHIPRIYKVLSAKHGSRFIHKILTQQETRQPRAQSILQCLLAENTPRKSIVSSSPDQDDRLRRAAEYMAGRFAAKEAVIKAHPQHNLTYHQVMIERMSKSTTVVQLDQQNPGQQPEDDPRSSGPPIATILLEGRPPCSAAISISHDGDYAMAVCIGVTAKTAP